MSRNAVVTGANRGIGLEFARQWLARGERVIATCRRPGKATELTPWPVNIRAGCACCHWM